jgi:hypothetical protein
MIPDGRRVSQMHCGLRVLEPLGRIEQGRRQRLMIAGVNDT